MRWYAVSRSGNWTEFGIGTPSNLTSCQGAWALANDAAKAITAIFKSAARKPVGCGNAFMIVDGGGGPAAFDVAATGGARGGEWRS